MKYIALLVLVVLGSCARENRPPEHQENACSILEQRRGWLADLQRSEREWGAPIHVQMAIIWKESNFRARVKTRKVYVLGSIPNGHISSAYGFSQALNGTWDDYRDRTGQRNAQRSDFGDATDFIGWYMSTSVRRSNIALDDAYNQYLAYHEGHGGFNRATYQTKSWLLNVAAQVRERAAQYEVQLQNCTG